MQQSEVSRTSLQFWVFFALNKVCQEPFPQLLLVEGKLGLYCSSGFIFLSDFEAKSGWQRLAIYQWCFNLKPLLLFSRAWIFTHARHPFFILFFSYSWIVERRLILLLFLPSLDQVSHCHRCLLPVRVHHPGRLLSI